MLYPYSCLTLWMSWLWPSWIWAALCPKSPLPPDQRSTIEVSAGKTLQKNIHLVTARDEWGDLLLMWLQLSTAAHQIRRCYPLVISQSRRAIMPWLLTLRAYWFFAFYNQAIWHTTHGDGEFKCVSMRVTSWFFFSLSPPTSLLHNLWSTSYFIFSSLSVFAALSTCRGNL